MKSANSNDSNKNMNDNVSSDEYDASTITTPTTVDDDQSLYTPPSQSGTETQDNTSTTEPKHVVLTRTKRKQLSQQVRQFQSLKNVARASRKEEKSKKTKQNNKTKKNVQMTKSASAKKSTKAKTTTQQNKNKFKTNAIRKKWKRNRQSTQIVDENLNDFVTSRNGISSLSDGSSSSFSNSFSDSELQDIDIDIDIGHGKQGKRKTNKEKSKPKAKLNTNWNKLMSNNNHEYSLESNIAKTLCVTNINNGHMAKIDVEEKGIDGDCEDDNSSIGSDNDDIGGANPQNNYSLINRLIVGNNNNNSRINVEKTKKQDEEFDGELSELSDNGISLSDHEENNTIDDNKHNNGVEKLDVLLTQGSLDAELRDLKVDYASYGKDVIKKLMDYQEESILSFYVASTSATKKILSTFVRP